MITEVLSHVSPSLRATAELYANPLGGSRALFSRIHLFDEGNLPQCANARVHGEKERRGFFSESLRHDEQLSNIAEQLAVAVRIEQPSCVKAVGGEHIAPLRRQ